MLRAAVLSSYFCFMAGNSFGTLFKLSSFGESHGVAIGGMIDGCPSGLIIDLEAIQHQLDRRKPGQSSITTARKESDTVQFLSGIFEGKSTGTPIGFIIPNQDQQSADYAALKDVYRPSHADYTYEAKYGIRDYRGGGRSSARETACRVVAGAIASQFLKTKHIRISAFVSQVGNIQSEMPKQLPTETQVDANIVRCPDLIAASLMEAHILEMKHAGDTVGGVITCMIEGVPAGLGEPVFDKLHADLGKAMLSINAVKGFEIGSGFSSVTMKGSEHNDNFETDVEGKIKTQTNHSGGIQGGISNGEIIWFKIAFKPVASIAMKQETLNTSLEKTQIEIPGRHDPCVIPRAVPIVEAMAALVVADHFLRAQAINPKISG
jgi:chorismate synthase